MKNAYMMPILVTHEMCGIVSVSFDSDPRASSLVGCSVTRRGPDGAETLRGIAVWKPDHIGHPAPDTIELDNGRTLYMR